jgi:hypothetical protein
MIILKEDSKKQAPLQEGLSPVSLEDVIGLGGFNGYTIHGPKLYVENFFITGATSLVQGPGSSSPQDVSLIANKRAIVSFPIKEIKSIGMRRLNVAFYLSDRTVIEFIR